MKGAVFCAKNVNVQVNCEVEVCTGRVPEMEV